MKEVIVRLDGGEYPLLIGERILALELEKLLNPLGLERLVVIADERMLSLNSWSERALRGIAVSLRLPLDFIQVSAGEEHKNLDTLTLIWNEMLDLGISRASGVIALGGGVIGDMGGFASACYMRGLPLWHVPTTLLSFVDSSIGGKTGVNHALGKNMIGVFKHPVGVVMDTRFLHTLPERQLCSGWFELIKHGLIADAGLFQRALDYQKRVTELGEISSDGWIRLVELSCRVKAKVVAADEREQGRRVLLNFGHSLGHLIETHTQYGACLHGEAVAVGMLFASWVSYHKEGLSKEEWQQICEALLPLMKPIVIPPLTEEQFCQLLSRDKKFFQGSLRFILLRSIGCARVKCNLVPIDLWQLFLGFISEFPSVLEVGSL